jgi:hypothetical protein
MNKLVPFTKFSNSDLKTKNLLGNASVVVDKRGVPLGFFFGRDTFVSLLTAIDEQFEKKARNAKEAYDNFAGRIIDLIEEKLPVNPSFIKDMETSITEARKKGWVSLQEVSKTLNILYWTI